LTVILVEPSRTQAGIVRKYLQELGIDKVHSTESGTQALELAREHGGQVFLCSLHLGEMTGMQLARLVRSDPACAHMGFVLTTSGGEHEDVSALRSMPRTVLMSKPFDSKKLAAALAEATGCSAPDRP
jgi:CheY-like chemotaxis protein